DDGVRIGSNAVVLKSISSGMTVVGVPGRLVHPPGERDAKRQAIAEKMGFDAYGATSDMPDPVANAVNGILDHIHVMDARLEEMCRGLKDLGAEIGDLNLPDLGPCSLKYIDDREIEPAVMPDTGTSTDKQNSES
ncbi:MAG TPA: hypothetical protein VIS57_08825, partial [Xanthomonadales bacterium]